MRNEAHFGDSWLTLNHTSSGKIHLIITPRWLDSKHFPVPVKHSQEGTHAQEISHRAKDGVSHEWRRNVRANPSAALWQPKEDAKQCMRCSELFSLRRRKHHCRACLRVYCNSCAQ